MLRRLNEKYSAYDMAQYIFRTVDELITEELMTRKNVLEFLDDIQLGMDYLQSFYGPKIDMNAVSNV